MDGPTRAFRSSFLTASALLAAGLAPPGPLAALREEGISRADAERIDRGYYEKISGPSRRLDASAPIAPAPFDAGRLCHPVADLREYLLNPGMETSHRGASWTTNSLGMRDREYPIEKPPGTTRLALVGDSIAAGWGVADGLGFEPRAERSLDGSAGPGRHVEFLNFSVPGHSPGQRWEHFRRTGWPTSPDLVVIEATPADPGWDERRLRGLLPRGIGWDSPLYREALASSGAVPGGDFATYKRILRPYRWPILENVYRSAAAECRSRGVATAWVLVPRVGKRIEPEDRARLIATARACGFSAVIDLSDAFDGLDPASLAIAPDDFHPNAEGHARLAERLEAALRSAPELRAILTKGGR